MFKIEYARDALKALKVLPRNVQLGIVSKIEQLAEHPFAMPQVKKLIGREGYRLRVGDWRIIYEIQGDKLVIYVLAIAPRGGIYK